MNRNRLLLIGIIALVIAALVSMRLLGMIKHSLASTVQFSPVVVANKDLNVGQQLTDADLKVISMPVADQPQGVFRGPAELLGRGVIVPIQASEIVLPSKLAAPEAGAGLPSMITPGKRAVSVKVNDVVAVAGFVVAGTHVDVIVTGTPRSDSDATTTTVLQDVPVLAAGKQMQHDSQGRPQDVPVITLLVSPADAQLLALASSEGKIQLALRNPTDTEKKDTGPVRNSTLYGANPVATSSKTKTKVVHAPAASKDVKAPADNGYSIEVIRGDKREVNKFEGDNGSKDNSSK
jgi:pilus assembly protein CpaB